MRLIRLKQPQPWLSLGALALLLLAGPWAKPALAAAARPAVIDSPEGVLWLFDSLLASPEPEKAEPLTVGPARRMFEMLKLSSQKIAPFVDTARSRDTVLAKRHEGGRAVVKLEGTVHFNRPFMGIDSIASVQAVQLARLNGSWRIAAFQELPQASAEITLPTAADSAAWQAEFATPAKAAMFFPVSKRMLPPRLQAHEVTRMTLRVSVRQGPAGPLDHLIRFQEKDGPQSLVQHISDTACIIAVTRPSWPLKEGPRELPKGSRKGSAKNWPMPNGSPTAPHLLPFLASTPYIDWQDSAMQNLAKLLLRALPASQRHPAGYARAVYDHLTAHFDFQFGATLFGTSRESLRRMRGDCSEGAVLTCALMRAQGIPARVAMGFASAGGGTFIGHAWCEAYFGEWVGIDAALREFPAGVQRVRLTASDGQGDLRVTATNLVLGVLNNLDIEMVSAEKNGRAITLVASPEDANGGRRFFEQILEGMGREAKVR